MRFTDFRALAAAGAALSALAIPAPGWAAGADFEREVLNDRPFAFYRLNETAPTSPAADLSGNLLNGTYSTTGVTLQQAVTAGDLGVAFSGGWVSIADNPLLSPERITIEAVVTWRGTTGAQQRICEKSTEPSGTTAVYNLCVSSEGSPLVEVDLGPSARVSLPSCAKLPVNQPVHLVTTLDGSTLSLYVDGTLGASVARTGTLNRGSTRPLTIGNQVERDRAFNGLIDEIAFYDHALTADRVLAHANTIPELTKPRVDCPIDGGPETGTGGTNGSGGTLGDGGIYEGGGSAGTAGTFGGGSGGSAGTAGAGATGASGSGGAAAAGGTEGVGGDGGAGGSLGSGGDAGSTGASSGAGGLLPDGAAGTHDVHSNPTVDIDGGCACAMRSGHRASVALLSALALGLLAAARRRINRR
jgi:MYXO-CTERM domain-containing protein